MSLEHMTPEHRHILTDEQRDIITRIEATMFYMAGDPDSQVPWLEWQTNEILDRIGLNDFTPSELVAFVGLIGPIFSRVLDHAHTRKSTNAVTPPLRLV